MFAEVSARRRLDTVQAVAEIDLVEIEPEDLLLGVDALETRRENQLLDLAPVGLVRRQEALAGELLRDRAAALGAAVVPYVRQRRRGDAHEIEPVMIEEALVLNRSNRLDEIGRHFRQRHLDALLLENRKGELVVVVEHRRRL